MVSAHSRRKKDFEKRLALERLEFTTRQKRELVEFEQVQSTQLEALESEFELERKQFMEQRKRNAMQKPSQRNRQESPIRLPPIPKHRQPSKEFIAKKPVPPPVPRQQDPLRTIENNQAHQKKRALIETADKSIHKKIKIGNSQSPTQSRLFSPTYLSCDVPTTSKNAYLVEPEDVRSNYSADNDENEENCPTQSIPSTQMYRKVIVAKPVDVPIFQSTPINENDNDVSELSEPNKSNQNYSDDEVHEIEIQNLNGQIQQDEQNKSFH